MLLYEMNETMKLLGKQYASENPQIKEVVNAHIALARVNKTDVEIVAMAMDLYNLGIINGIKKERRKRHARRSKGVTSSYPLFN